jgi:hypothetical protein
MLKRFFLFFIVCHFAISHLEAFEAPIIDSQLNEKLERELESPRVENLLNLLKSFPHRFVEMQGSIKSLDSLPLFDFLSASEQKRFLKLLTKKTHGFSEIDRGRQFSDLRTQMLLGFPAPSSLEKRLNVLKREFKTSLSLPSLQMTRRNYRYDIKLKKEIKVALIDFFMVLVEKNKIKFFSIRKKRVLKESFLLTRSEKIRGNGKTLWIIGPHSFSFFDSSLKEIYFQLPQGYRIAGWPLKIADSIFIPLVKIHPESLQHDYFLSRWSFSRRNLLQSYPLFSRYDRLGHLREQLWLPGTTENFDFFYLTHCGGLLFCDIGDGRPREFLIYPSRPLNDLLLDFQKKKALSFCQKKGPSTWWVKPQDASNIFKLDTKRRSLLPIKDKASLPENKWMANHHFVIFRQGEQISLHSAIPFNLDETVFSKKKTVSSPLNKQQKNFEKKHWISNAPLDIQGGVLKWISKNSFFFQDGKKSFQSAWPRWKKELRQKQAPKKHWAPPPFEILKENWKELSENTILTGDQNPHFKIILKKIPGAALLEIKNQKNEIWTAPFLFPRNSFAICLENEILVLDEKNGKVFFLGPTGKKLAEFQLLESGPFKIYLFPSKIAIVGKNIFMPFSKERFPPPLPLNTFLKNKVLIAQKRQERILLSPSLKSHPAKSPLKIDGILDDDYKEEGALSFYNMPRSRIYASHTDKGLLLGLRIFDDSPFNAVSLDSSKKGDFIMVAWDALSDSRQRPQSDDALILFGSRDPNNPEPLTFKALGKQARILKSQMAIYRDVDNKFNCYEIFIPWDDLGHHFPLRLNIAYHNQKNKEEEEIYALMPGLGPEKFSPHFMIRLEKE